LSTAAATNVVGRNLVKVANGNICHGTPRKIPAPWKPWRYHPLPDSLGASSDMFAFAFFPGTKPKHISASFPCNLGAKSREGTQIKGALSD